MGTQLRLPQRGKAPNFGPMSAVAKRLDVSSYATWYKSRPRSGDIVLDGGPSPPKKGHSPSVFARVYCGQTASWMDQGATWYEGRPRPRPHNVRRGPSPPPSKRAQSPIFRPMSVVAKRSPILATAEHLFNFVRCEDAS